MPKVCERFAQVAVLVGVLGTLSNSQAGAANVGAVMSTTGNAYAVSETGRRPLACGSIIESGERIVTEAGARVGFLASDTYVQVGADSDVTVNRTAGGSAALGFHAGTGRVIDTRESGAPFDLTTPHSASRGLGTDTEVSVNASGTELCEGAATLEIHSARAQANSGECVTVPQSGASTTAARGEARIPAVGAEGCIEVAVLDHFTPGVSAPSQTLGLAPFDPNRVIYNGCDRLGGDCVSVSGMVGGGGGTNGGPGVIITETPPPGTPPGFPIPGGGVVITETPPLATPTGFPTPGGNVVITEMPPPATPTNFPAPGGSLISEMAPPATPMNFPTPMIVQMPVPATPGGFPVPGGQP